MFDYKKTDYATNKFSENIVYKFADGTKKVITLEDFLKENPSKTADDFQILKEFSNENYHQIAKNENSYSKNTLAIEDVCEDDLPYKETFCDDENMAIEKIAIAKNALIILTETQRRQYLLHVVNGLTLREIAKFENVGFTKIQNSIEQAEKKIKKYLENFEK